VIRDLIQWHENPRLVAFAATRTGRCVVWVVSALLLLWHATRTAPILQPVLGLLVAVLGLTTLWPRRRREILSVASVLALLAWLTDRSLPTLDLSTPATWGVGAERWLRFGVLASGILVGLALGVRAAAGIRGWPSPMRRFPVISLHACGWAVLAWIPVAPVLGVAAELLPFVIWRLSYLVQYCVRIPAPRTRVRDHLFYLWPVVGVSRSVPVTKGLDYLERHEAVDRVQLAGSQLAGIKLLGLALGWAVLGWCMDAAVYGDPASPAFAWFGGRSVGFTALPDLLASHHATMGQAVPALYLHLIRDTLRLATIGHVLVGWWRLTGFRVFRAVYRPLLAESVLDFWNRRTWYLKELLTEFFFYPTFVRASWAPLRLRLFLAVFAAAGIGNLYCHVVERLPVRGGEASVPALASHAVYSALLACGIWVSMLRERSRRARGPVARTRWQRIRARAGVWTFFALIHVWSSNLSSLGPLERLRWLASVLTP